MPTVITVSGVEPRCYRNYDKGQIFHIQNMVIYGSEDTLAICNKCGMSIYDEQFKQYHK